MWARRILPVVGDVRIQRFLQRDYNRLDADLESRGLSGKYRRNIRVTLRTLFEWASESDYVPRNVMALTEPPSTEDSKARDAFTLDEARALLAVEDRLHPIWRLFLETGARRGEVVGLKDEDVSGAHVKIRRQVLVHPSPKWSDERVYVRQTTKSRKERTVTVSDEMGALLRRWKVQRGREQLAFGPAYEAGSSASQTARGSHRTLCWPGSSH